MDNLLETATVHHRRPEGMAFRSVVVNFLAALTVNAAIVLSAPRSSTVDPVPMVLQRKHQLIDGRWREGEYLDGIRPSIVLVDLDDTSSRAERERLITDN